MEKVWNAGHGDGVVPQAHIDKVKAAGKAAAQAESDFELWMDADDQVLKAGEPRSG